MFGFIHPRYLTPSTSTIWMGALSIAWYVGLTIVSEKILFDSIAALGLMIAFYYGLTGFACAIYYRRELFKNAKTFLFMGLAPAARRPGPGFRLRQVRHRLGRSGQLGVRRLVVWAGTASRYRHRVPRLGCRADAASVAGDSDLLPPQAGGGAGLRG